MTIKFRLNTFAKSFNASRRPGALMEFMLKCAPEKSDGFKTEPFEMSISTERGCSSGSEKAKPRERERKRVYCTIKT